jgi:hypothetical protein
MKVAFLENKLTLRGSTLSIYNYANFNETLLNNESVIITRSYEQMKDSRDVDIKAYDMFNNRFKVFYYRDVSDIEHIIKEQQIDILYIQKSGLLNDELITNICKCVIHCVFETFEPHGDVCASISDWNNIRYNTNMKVVPYMVHVAEPQGNLRKELNIPDDALVFGTYSGSDGNVEYILDTVKLLGNNTTNNIYFIFMNITPFCEPTNKIMFFNGTSDINIKRKFIDTCDAMLYMRIFGETFGLACGEFSLCNKLVIAHKNPEDKSHINFLKSNIVLHENKEELVQILTSWKDFQAELKNDFEDNDYKMYTPEKVMNIFKEVFLS